MKKFFDFSHFKSDALGGITAGIVALPLALAFGEQSGLGAAAGLYGAAFIAFFAALFGGTPTQISGPTAPMTALSMVVVAGILKTFEGNLEQALPLILFVFLLAGGFQIILGVLKLGTYIKYIPYTVISGFMTGIGVIILITQLLPLLGYYSGEDKQVIDSFMPQAEKLLIDRILANEAKDGVLILEDFQASIQKAKEITETEIRAEAMILAKDDSKSVLGALKYLPNAVKNIDLLELALALLTIAIIYGFKRITTSIPSTLVALLLVAGGAYFIGFDYVQIREIPIGYPDFKYEIFSSFDIGVILPFVLTAFLLSLLGAIDSLLTSVVADNLTRTQHDPNKELFGQGIGNGIAAMFGGLPGAGATIRTVVNIQAGGKTKISGMIAGVLLFIILMVLGPIASQIPAAVLAGILITVGVGVMDYKGLKAIPKMGLSEKVILITVLLLTVFWQLVYAVAVGLVLASIVFLKKMSDVSANKFKVSAFDKVHENEPLWQDEIEIPENIREKVFFKHLNAPMFFGIVTNFRELVSGLPDIHLLIIRMEKVPFIDLSGLYALENAIEDLHRSGVVVAVSGPNDQVKEQLYDMNVFPDLVAERYVFDNFRDCKEWLQDVLSQEDGLDEELKKLKEKK